MERTQVKPAWMHVGVPITLIVVKVVLVVGIYLDLLSQMFTKMHVKTLLVQYVLMVAAWALMVSAPVADLLIAALYIVSLNIHSVSLPSMLSSWV